MVSLEEAGRIILCLCLSLYSNEMLKYGMYYTLINWPSASLSLYFLGPRWALNTLNDDGSKCSYISSSSDARLTCVTWTPLELHAVLHRDKSSCWCFLSVRQRHGDRSREAELCVQQTFCTCSWSVLKNVTALCKINLNVKPCNSFMRRWVDANPPILLLPWSECLSGWLEWNQQVEWTKTSGRSDYIWYE